MMGPAHRSLGVVFGIGYGVAAGLPIAGVLGCGVLATLTAAGRFSPDVDQTRGWHRLDRWVPDELLGHGGPLRHRGLTHWWGLVAAATAAWWVLLLPSAARGGSGGLIAHGAGALLAGWWSHLAGDLVFGKADVRSGRGPGIPLAPWWGHTGFALDVGGWVERITTGALGLVAVGQVLAHLGLLSRLVSAGRLAVLRR